VLFSIFWRSRCARGAHGGALSHQAFLLPSTYLRCEFGLNKQIQTVSEWAPADIYCVTKWSKLDTTWRGVTFDNLLKAVGLSEPPTPYVMAHSDGGYTTNLPVADLVGGKGMIVTRYEDLPIPPVHGGPARLFVPHLYFWKSAKWVRRLRFMEKDERGFWESLGYHNYGDPWKEQRYDGD
jgi:DMSO/TMAO reductase YedYZ molybdopterin-dependent catalytic subunit